MKNFTIIHVLLFLLFLLAYQCASAQDYVVTLSGDTVKGSVKPLSFGVEKKVQVNTGDDKQVYSIIQTRAYFLDGETFVPVRLEHAYTFMKILKPGYLSLYAFQREGQTTYDGLYLRKRGGDGLEVPNLAFKKLISRFLEDCSPVVERIDNGELGKRDIEAIVDEYNLCIEKRTSKVKDAIVQTTPAVSTSEWDALEQKVKAKPSFEGKTDALEMISEIKKKVSRSEKVPNFILEGLKNSLSPTDLAQDLESAIKGISQ